MHYRMDDLNNCSPTPGFFLGLLVHYYYYYYYNDTIATIITIITIIIIIIINIISSTITFVSLLVLLLLRTAARPAPGFFLGLTVWTHSSIGLFCLFYVFACVFVCC